MAVSSILRFDVSWTKRRETAVSLKPPWRLESDVFGCQGRIVGGTLFPSHDQNLRAFLDLPKDLTGFSLVLIVASISRTDRIMDRSVTAFRLSSLFSVKSAEFIISHTFGCRKKKLDEFSDCNCAARGVATGQPNATLPTLHSSQYRDVPP